MSQKFLYGPDVVTVFQQMGRERVAQGVATYVLGDAGSERSLFDAANHEILIDMMPPDYAGFTVGRALV